jgi:hypothetical protein
MLKANVLPETLMGFTSGAIGFGGGGGSGILAAGGSALVTTSGDRVCSRSTSTIVQALSPDDDPHFSDPTSTLAPQPTVAVRRTTTTKGMRRFVKSARRRWACGTEKVRLTTSKLSSGSGRIVRITTGSPVVGSSRRPSLRARYSTGWDGISATVLPQEVVRSLEGNREGGVFLQQRPWRETARPLGGRELCC